MYSIHISICYHIGNKLKLIKKSFIKKNKNKKCMYIGCMYCPTW